jgi:hypothetical protein
MARRKVTHSRKDEDGDITALCNPVSFWSPRLKAGAISDIESKTHQYFVRVGDQEVDIHVVDGSTGKYLRTDPDKTSTNNLDDLPDC